MSEPVSPEATAVLALAPSSELATAGGQSGDDEDMVPVHTSETIGELTGF
jgi:hypothetical protein